MTSPQTPTNDIKTVEQILLHLLPPEIHGAIRPNGLRVDTDINKSRRDQATAQINALRKQDRIDELERLSHTKWTDLAYDIPGYLKERLAELLKEIDL